VREQLHLCQPEQTDSKEHRHKDYEGFDAFGVHNLIIGLSSPKSKCFQTHPPSNWHKKKRADQGRVEG
jgi:hypothetical protein